MARVSRKGRSRVVHPARIGAVALLFAASYCESPSSALGQASLATPAVVATTSGPYRVQLGPLRLGPVRDVTSALNIGYPLDLAIATDGSFAVVDYSKHEILRFTPDGEVLWRAGRQGQGPGEFQTLGRVTIDTSGNVLALDISTLEISRFDPEGNFVGRKKLPVRLRAVTDMVALHDDRVALVGVVSTIGLHSIRVFDREMRQVAAFGPLPSAQNPQVLTYWGAGGLHVGEDDSLLFTLKIPYRIYRYSWQGDLISQFDGPFDFLTGPDDAFTEFSDGEVTRIGEASAFVPHPWTARDLGEGWVLGGVRTSNEGGTWDLFHDGLLITSVPAPNGWPPPAEIDRARKLMYVKTRDEQGNLIYLQIPYEFER